MLLIICKPDKTISIFTDQLCIFNVILLCAVFSIKKPYSFELLNSNQIILLQLEIINKLIKFNFQN